MQTNRKEHEKNKIKIYKDWTKIQASWFLCFSREKILLAYTIQATNEPRFRSTCKPCIEGYSSFYNPVELCSCLDSLKQGSIFQLCLVNYRYFKYIFSKHTYLFLLITEMQLIEANIFSSELPSKYTLNLEQIWYDFYSKLYLICLKSIQDGCHN